MVFLTTTLTHEQYSRLLSRQPSRLLILQDTVFLFRDFVDVTVSAKDKATLFSELDEIRKEEGDDKSALQYG